MFNYLPTNFLFICSSNCKFHFYRNILFWYLFMFLFFFTCSNFFFTVCTTFFCWIFLIHFFFILCSLQFEMECIAPFGRCSAERISVFDYLHKNIKRKYKLACYATDGWCTLFLSSPSTLSSSFSLFTYQFVCWFVVCVSVFFCY